MPTLGQFLKQDVPQLQSVNSRIGLILFLTIFIYTFLSVYDPFAIGYWSGSILGYVLIGSGVLILNQIVIRSISKKKKPRLYQIIRSAAIEILVMTLLIQIAYGPQFPSIRGYVDEYLLTLRYVCLIVIGPYALAIWYFANRHIEVSKLNSSLYDSQRHDKVNEQLLTIKSESNKTIFGINYDQLLYVQSSGNYLDIHFLKENVKSKETVRASLKELEEKIGSSNIIRIHRSYMVNKNKISSFKKTRKGYELSVLHAPGQILSVSTSYKSSFEQALSLNLTH